MHYEVIVDTGILLALIDRNDSHHTWVTERLKEIAPPLLTCEAVISESWFLLQRVKRGREILLQLLAQKQIIIQFDLDAELVTVMTLVESLSISTSFFSRCGISPNVGAIP
jgi:predicted nucleic acid-binding protein